jgi:RND superfamily putative drug exporter
MTGLLERWGAWAVDHRRRIVVGWLLAVALLLVLAANLGGQFREEFAIPGTGSDQAQDLLKERFPQQSGGSARVVFETPDGRVADEANTAAVQDLRASLGELEGVAIVGDPYQGFGGAISEDGTIGFVDVRWSDPIGELGRETLDELDAAVEPARAAGLEVGLSGELPAYYQSPELGGPELAVKIGAALIIMLISFGSILATGLPLGLALFGLAGGAALIRLLSAVVDVPSSSLLLGVMIGLGVGIDYALFIVTRHRQHLAEGMDVRRSVGRAIATAGQAVIFAGGTVVIAIGGLAVAGIPAAAVMGLSAAIVVTVMVVAAITLLPALLGFSGESIDRWRLPGMKARTEAGTDNRWGRFARHVADQPWRHLVLGTVVLLLMAVPLLSMRLAMPDASTTPEGSPRRIAHELLVDGFGPGFSGPLVVVVDLPSADGADGADGMAAAGALREAIAADPAVAAVGPAVPNEAGDTVILQVTPTAAPQDEPTEELVQRLRAEVIPAAFEGTDGTAYVGGVTAQHIDLTTRASDRLLWFMLTIIGLSVGLLMLVFRSVWVPVKAAAMNLLSVGAGYGAVVAVFQWGWLGGLFGLEQPVPVVSMVPMIMFAVLFGLSMDYEVFLLSRAREEYLRTGDNTESVISGVATTARVITSAALIMIVVFLGFAMGDTLIIQQIGLGLAVAVAVDATIVRVILVPSTMVLLGDRNWTLPRWLDRILPHLDIEGSAAEAATDVPAERTDSFC